MPAVVSSTVGSKLAGTSDAEGTRWCARSSKNARYRSRISADCIAPQSKSQPPWPICGGIGAKHACISRLTPPKGVPTLQGWPAEATHFALAPNARASGKPNMTW